MTGHGVQCWGMNDNGQLGVGSTGNRNSPVDVPGAGADPKFLNPYAILSCLLDPRGAPSRIQGLLSSPGIGQFKWLGLSAWRGD